MKKRLFVFSLAFLCALITINAQSGYGIKVGFGYNSNGKLKGLGSELNDIVEDSKGKSAFNIGFYGKLDLGPVFIRPELVYTRTTSEYELNNLVDYKINKLDAPVLLGIEVIGPLSFMIGPAFQYIFDNDLKGVSFNSIENEFTVGLNLGASVELGRFGFDLRYERGFSENEAEFDGIDDIPAYRLDSRPKLLIFSISYRLSSKRQVP
jgi:hypothetical protein